MPGRWVGVAAAAGGRAMSGGGGYRLSEMLGAWLREQRRSRGWDVPQMARQIARAAGDNRGALPSKECLLVYIRRWERGGVGVSERYMLLYCGAFGITPDQFGPGAYSGGGEVAGDLGVGGDDKPDVVAPRP